MRRFSIPTSVLAGALLATTAFGSPFPYEGIIRVDRSLNVRSGPSERYYRTSLLKRGDRVLVLAEQDGWLAIKPPPDSFSWVSGEYVEANANGTGKITGDRVNVRVGTLISEKIKETIQVQLHSGDPITILDRVVVNEGQLAQTWYKIVPPDGEVRWVHSKYVMPASESSPGPAVQNSKGLAREHSYPPAPYPSDRSAAREPRPASYLEDQNVSGEQEGWAPSRPSAMDGPGMDITPGNGGVLNATEFAQSPRANVLDMPRHAEQPHEHPVIQTRSDTLDRFEAIFGESAPPDQSVEPIPDSLEPESASPSLVATGILRRSSVGAKARYILSSTSGVLTYYLTPAPGLNPDALLEKRVAVRGKKTYRNDWRAYELIAEQLQAINLP